MNAGVRTSPCAVVRTPERARLPGSRARMRSGTAMKKSDAGSRAPGTPVGRQLASVPAAPGPVRGRSAGARGPRRPAPTSLRAGVLAGVDRRRRALLADLDRDAARLARLGLGDADLEHALVERGGDRLWVDAIRQRERAAEAAVRPLDAVEALPALLVLGLALARDGQDVALDVDRDVALAEAGQIGLEREVVLGLD